MEYSYNVCFDISLLILTSMLQLIVFFTSSWVVVSCFFIFLNCLFVLLCWVIIEASRLFTGVSLVAACGRSSSCSTWVSCCDMQASLVVEHGL